MSLVDIIGKLNDEELKNIQGEEDTSTGTSYDRERALQEDLFLSQERVVRYRDYDVMEKKIPEVSSALDILADDITHIDPTTNAPFWITSDSERTSDMLQDFLINHLQLDQHIWIMARDLLKYGDEFEEIVVSENGVEFLKSLDASTMFRMEDEKGNLLKFEQKPNFYFNDSTRNLYASLPRLQQGAGAETSVDFVPWQVIHSRILTDNRNALYGSSFLEKARYTGNLLRLMEEALAMLRTQKSYDRRIIFIDSRELDPMRALKYTDDIMRRMKRKRFSNNDSFNSFLNPLAPTEDLYLPIRKDDATRVETLAGVDTGKAIEDIKYMRNKLISILKVPAAYLGFTEDYSGFVNNTLQMQDRRYTRTVRRYQQYMKFLINRVCEIQLSITDFPYEERGFEVNFTNSNQLEEQAAIEIMSMKAELAKNLQDVLPMDWILKNVLMLPEEEINSILAKMVDQNSDSDSSFGGTFSSSPAGMSGMGGSGVDTNPDEVTQKYQKVILDSLKSKGISESKLKSIVTDTYKNNKEFKESVNSFKSLLMEHKKLLKNR